jgi:pectate lyase
LCLGTAASSAEEAVPVFPGAMGFGSNAIGWRGGEVQRVTNLKDSGPGSLRACAQNSEKPRFCVFAVSGTIALDDSIYVRPNVYIAGQTAPGQGVELKLRTALASPLIIKNSHDVVVRYLKLRPGKPIYKSNAVSALLIENSHDVMVDHVSIAFATDQNFSVHFQGGKTFNLTLQRSIVAWGLDHSNHPKGKHSKGALVCSGVKTGGECGRITLRENIFAHNRDRNPELVGTAYGPIEAINNVIYDPISEYGEVYDRYADTRVVFLNNLGIAGPSTKQDPIPMVKAGDETRDYRVTVVAAGNMVIRRKQTEPQPAGYYTPTPEDLREPTPEEIPQGLRPAATLVEALLPIVGARRPDGRLEDDLDRLLLASVKERSGRVIDDVADLGAVAPLPIAEAGPDSDGDGMDDAWETAHGFDPHDPSDAAKPSKDHPGQSNLEVYLSDLAGDYPG